MRNNNWWFWPLYFTLAGLALFWVASAFAAPKHVCEWNPPAKYDREPVFKYKIKRFNKAGLEATCDALLIRLGFPTIDGYYGCADLTGKTLNILKGGSGCVTEEIIIRHERGHLNGWSHPNP